jgi:haloalkane dehalogenase
MTTDPALKQAAVPGGSMAYVDEGSGVPVVLVHGTPSSSREWMRVAAALSGDYRVLAPDHLGFGRSDRPADWRVYALGWHTENFRSWLKQAVIGRFHLVVHDFGGPIALPVALDDPARLLSLTVVQSWFWNLKGPNVDNWLMRWLYLRWNFSARMLVKLSWGRRVKLTRELHREFLEQFPDRDSRAGTWGFARSISHDGPALEARAQELIRLQETPALIIWGKADKLVKPLHLQRWKELLPGAEVLELEDVGHFPQLEAPEEVAQAIRKRISV